MAATLDAARRGRDCRGGRPAAPAGRRRRDRAAGRRPGVLVVPARAAGHRRGGPGGRCGGPALRDLAVVVRGPAPGRLRGDARSPAHWGCRWPARCAPSRRCAEALERGEAPAAAGRGPLAALCRRLIAELTGLPCRVRHDRPVPAAFAARVRQRMRRRRRPVTRRRSSPRPRRAGRRGARRHRRAAVADACTTTWSVPGRWRRCCADPASPTCWSTAPEVWVDRGAACSGRRCRSPDDDAVRRLAAAARGRRRAAARRRAAVRRRPAARRHPAARGAAAGGADRAVPVAADVPARGRSPSTSWSRHGTVPRRAGAAARRGRGRPAGVPGHRRHRLGQDHAAQRAAGLVPPDRAIVLVEDAAELRPVHPHVVGAPGPDRPTWRARARSG